MRRLCRYDLGGVGAATAGWLDVRGEGMDSLLLTAVSRLLENLNTTAD